MIFDHLKRTLTKSLVIGVARLSHPISRNVWYLEKSLSSENGLMQFVPSTLYSTFVILKYCEFSIIEHASRNYNSTYTQLWFFAKTTHSKQKLDQDKAELHLKCLLLWLQKWNRSRQAILVKCLPLDICGD